MRHLESRLQSDCVAWARLQHPVCRKHLFAVGNGVRTTAIQGRIAKGEGVLAGVSDLILLYPSSDGRYASLCIEMKTEKGRQSDSQREWQKAIESVGIYRYEVIRTFGEFQRLLNEYLSYDH